MASCTYNPGINSSNPYATLTVTESSYNVANNTSVVSWNLKLYRPYNISSSASKDYKVVINGSTVKSGTTTIGGSGTKTIASGTKTISHNADGSKTISFSFSLEFDITWSGTKIGTGSKSGSLKLTTIPRATTPTVSASSVDMGNTVTVTMSRASSSFTHTLQYTFAGTTTTIATGLGTSKAWEIPITLASKIPNATSGTLTFTCITYNGSTKIGSKTVSITAKVPGSIKPTASLAISEAVAKVASTFGVYVKGLSQLTIKTTGTGSYGSTIKSYKVVANGSTYTSATATTGVLASSGNMTITATVTDSRGRTGTATQTISVSNYAKPVISSFSASRVDNATEDNYDNLSVVVKGSVSAINGNNGTYKLDLKKSTDSDYPTTPISTGSLTNYAVNTTVTLNEIDVDSSYDLRLTITDGYGNSTPKSIEISTAFTLVDYHTSGKGLAFGKVAEIENYIESALRLSLPSKKGTYIKGMIGENASLQISDQQAEGHYNPYMFVKTLNNHIWNLSGINDTVGFYGFYNGRTENSYDWRSYWNVNTGAFIHSGALTVGGATTLNTTLAVTGTLEAKGQTTLRGHVYMTKNDAIIYGRTTTGKDYEAFVACTESDNVAIGYGLYSAGLNQTNIYGNIIQLTAKNGIKFSGYIASQVNLGTGTASDSNRYYFNNNGTGRFNALRYTSIAQISSARRYKENIDYKDIDYWHNGLMQVKPCTYNYIAGEDKSKKIGVIAEDLAECLPELVEFNDEGQCETVYYMDFIMPLVAESQLQDERMTNLESKIVEQDEIIKSQDERISKLESLVNNLISKIGGM